MWTELLKTSLKFITKTRERILWRTIETLIKLTIKNYGLVIRSYSLGIYKLNIGSRFSKFFI